MVRSIKDTYFTTINGAARSASSCCADRFLPNNVNTVWRNRRGLRPAESLFTSLPSRHTGPTLQPFDSVATTQNDRNIFAPATITNAITHTYPIAINKVSGEYAPAEKTGAITQAYPIADNKISGEYVYPYKQTVTNAPIHACLAGYDGEIFKIIDDIKETSGSEIEVHFYLFYNCKFNILGSHMTNVKNLQDVLSKYHHYICLNKKYIDTMYKPKEHCWYIEKLIVIPSFHNDVDLLYKDLPVQDFSKMCYRNEFEPLVIEVEEKFNNLAKKNEDEIICLRDINKIYDKADVASISNNIWDSNALKYNTEFMNWKIKNRAHSDSNSNGFLQPVALKYSTPTVSITSYGPYTQGYARNIGAPCSRIWFGNAPSSNFEDTKSHDEKICNSGQNNVPSNNMYNAQNTFTNYVKDLNVITASPVCNIISNNEQSKSNVDDVPVVDGLKTNLVNIVDKKTEKVSPNIIQFLPANSQGRPCVVSENDKIQIVNANTNNYPADNQIDYKQNQNWQSYWNQELYQKNRKGVCNNAISGLNIDYGSNSYPASVVLQQNDIESNSASNVTITPIIGTAVSSNKQHITQLQQLPNYSLLSNAMATPKTRIYVSQLTPNMWANILESKIPSYTTSIPSYSDVASKQLQISSIASEIPVPLQKDKYVSNVRPLDNLQFQPLQTISSYTPSQSTSQLKLFAPYVQISEALHVQPTETFQPLKTVQTSQVLSSCTPQLKQLDPYVQPPNFLSIYNPHQSAYTPNQFAPYIEATYMQSLRPPNVQSSEAITSYTPLQSRFAPSTALVNTQFVPQFVSSLPLSNLIVPVKKNTENRITSYEPSLSQRYQEFIAFHQPPKSTFVSHLNSRPYLTSTSDSTQNILIQPQNHVCDFTRTFEQPSILMGDQKLNLLLNKIHALQYSHAAPQLSVNDLQSITQTSDCRPKNEISSYQTSTSETPVNVNIITPKQTYENNQVSIIHELPFKTPNVKPVLPISNKGVLNLLADTYFEQKPVYQTIPYVSTAAGTNPTLLTSYTSPKSSPVKYREVLPCPSPLLCPLQDGTSQQTNMNVKFDTKAYTDHNGENSYETISSGPAEGIPNNLNVISEFTPKTKLREFAKLLDNRSNQPMRPSNMETNTISLEPEQISEAQMTLIPSCIPNSVGISRNTEPISQKVNPNIRISNYIRQTASLPRNMVYTYTLPLNSPNVRQKNASPNTILPYSCNDMTRSRYNIWSSVPAQRVPCYATRNSANNIVSVYNPSQVLTNVDSYSPQPKPCLVHRPENVIILQPTYMKDNNIRPIICSPCSNAANDIFTPYVFNYKVQNRINALNPFVCGKAKSPKDNIKIQPITYQKLFRGNYFVPSTQTTERKVYDNSIAFTSACKELPIAYKEVIPSTQRVWPCKPYKENINVIHSYTEDASEVAYTNLAKTRRYPRLNLVVSQGVPIINAVETIKYIRPESAVKLANKVPYINVCKSVEHQEPKVKKPDDVPINTNENYVCINSYTPVKQPTNTLRGIPVAEPIQPLHVSVIAGQSNLPIGGGNVRSDMNEIIPNVDIVEPATIKQSAQNVDNQHKTSYEYIKTYVARPVNANKEMHSTVKLVPCADGPRPARDDIFEITNYTPYLKKASAAIAIPCVVSDINKPDLVSYSQRKDQIKLRPKGIVKNMPCYQAVSSNSICAANSKQCNKLTYMVQKKPKNYQFIDCYSKPQLTYKQVFSKPVFANIATPKYITTPNFNNKNIPCTKINPNIISVYLPSSNFEPHSRKIPTKIEDYNTDRKPQTINIKCVDNNLETFNLISNYINPRPRINILSYSRPCTDPTNICSKTIPKYKEILSNLGPENQQQFVNIQSYTKPSQKVRETVLTYTTNPKTGKGYTMPWLTTYINPELSGRSICDTISTYSKGSSILTEYQPSCIKTGKNEIPVKISTYASPERVICAMPIKPTYTPINICNVPRKNYLSSVRVSSNTCRQSSGVSANSGTRSSINIENYDNILSYTPRNQHGVCDQINKYIMQPQSNTIASSIQPKKDEKYVTVEAYTNSANKNFDQVAFPLYVNKIGTPHQRVSTYRDTATKKFITIDSNTKTQNYKPVISYYKPAISVYNQQKPNSYTNLQYVTHKAKPKYDNILGYQPLKYQAYQSVICNTKPCVVDRKSSLTPTIPYTGHIPMEKESYIKPVIQYGSYIKPRVYTQKYKTNNIITNYQTITPQRYNSALYYKPQSILRQKPLYTLLQTVKVSPYSTMASTPDMTATPNLITTYGNPPKIAKTRLNVTKTSTAPIVSTPDAITTYTKYPTIDITKYYEINRVPNNINQTANTQRIYYEPYTKTFRAIFKTPAKFAEKVDQVPSYTQNSNNIQINYDTIPTYTKPVPLMEYIQKSKSNNPNTVYNEISTYTTVPTEAINCLCYEPQDFKTVYNQILAKTNPQKMERICQKISSYTTFIKTAEPIKNVQSVGWYENRKTNNQLVYTPLVNLIKDSSNGQLVKNKEQYQLIPCYTQHKVDFARKVAQICPNIIHHLKPSSPATSYFTKAVTPCYIKTVTPSTMRTNIPCYTKPNLPCYTKTVTPCYIKTVTPCNTKEVPQLPQTVLLNTQEKPQYVPCYTVTKKGFTNGHKPLYIPQRILSNVSHSRPQIMPWISQIQAQVIPHYTVNQNQPAEVRYLPRVSHIRTTNIINNHLQNVPGYYVTNRYNTVTQERTTNVHYSQYRSRTKVLNKISQIMPDTQQRVQTVPCYTVTQKHIPNVIQYSPCVTANLLHNRPQMAPLNAQEKMQIVPHYTVTQKETIDVPCVPCDTKIGTNNILYNNGHKTVPSYTLERAVNTPYYTTQVPNKFHQSSISSGYVLCNQNDCNLMCQPKTSYTQGQASTKATSNVEVQNFLQCIQNYITRYITSNPQFIETLNKIYDNPDAFITPLSSISLVNCRFANRQPFAVKRLSNSIEIRGFLNKVKIIKPKMVFETEEVDVPNFVPVVKGRQVINNEIVQSYVRNSLRDKYQFLVVNQPCPVTGNCVVNWDSRGGVKKAIIWPSTYVDKK